MFVVIPNQTSNISSFIHSFVHLNFHSFIHSFELSFIHLFIWTFIHSFILTFIHLCLYLNIHSFIYSFKNSFKNSFIQEFIHLFVAFIHLKLFIHTSVHVFAIDVMYSCMNATVSYSIGKEFCWLLNLYCLKFSLRKNYVTILGFNLCAYSLQEKIINGVNAKTVVSICFFIQ